MVTEAKGRRRTVTPLPPRFWSNWLILMTICFPVALVGTLGASVEIGRAYERQGSAVELVDQRIDPNTAPWWQLAQLPRIGEKIAKAIVTSRSERPSPAFQKLADLDEIPRIGPKTLERIGPYLRFSPESRPSEVDAAQE